MPNLKGLGKLLGVGEDYVEKYLAKQVPKPVPGQDISTTFRPPKVSDLGTHEMDVSNVKQLYDEFINQGASHSDDRMKQLRNIISRKEGMANRNAQQLADRKANMITPAGGEEESQQRPQPMSFAEKMRKADNMGMQMGMGVVGADAQNEGESVDDIAKAKAASLRKMLGME